MTARRRLPDRRASVTFDIEAQGLRFTCTASWFADESLAEVFLQNHKAGSMAGINAQDAVVICSIALQFGVPLEVMRRALMRDARGAASGPLGVALDALAAMNRSIENGEGPVGETDPSRKMSTRCRGKTT